MDVSPCGQMVSIDRRQAVSEERDRNLDDPSCWKYTRISSFKGTGLLLGFPFDWINTLHQSKNT